tara:strand:+ start:1973 stop:2995 length:1023 start_codon:yes stop_codon:yes gene_type:complete
MKYRKFSDLGWNISEVSLGCWQLGWCWGEKLSEQEVEKMLKKSIDLGVNFFDTSDTYGDGRSEKFLSKIAKSSLSGQQKEKIYITTKLGRRHRNTKYPKTLYPEGIYTLEAMEEFVDRSLKNLRLEKIDLLQLHCPPLEVLKDPKTQDVLKTLVKKGKILNYGVSIYYLSEGYEAMKIPDLKSIQIQFSMIRQKPNESFFDLAKKNNIAVIVRGPLASGLLSGEINKDTKFPENDHRNYNLDGSKHNVSETFAGVDFEQGLKFVEELKKILPKNFNLSELALKWILMHDKITTVIPGSLNQSQVEANSLVSSKESIGELMPEIRSLYEKIIKKDNHDLWD